MKKLNITNYFLQKSKDEKDSVNFLKNKSLVLILIIASLLLLLLSVKIMLFNSFIAAMVPLFIVVICITILIIIKLGNPEVAANVFSIILVALLIFAMFKNIRGASLPYFMLSYYYIFFIVITFSAMYSNKTIYFINISAIFVSSVYIFYANESQIPPNVLDISDYGFTLYLTAFFMISIFNYLFINFIGKAISNVTKKKEELAKNNIMIRNINKQIKIVASELQESYAQLSTISEQVSESAGSQAANIEEVSASIEQMLASITSNTENAEQSQSSIIDTSSSLEQNNEIIIQTIELVNQISEKISIISEIASKTDILSINAAIEAARAGDSGKGFAVVAQEIRKLADTSKNAAEEIKKLSIRGNEMSLQANKALEKMLPEIMLSSEIIKGIFSASKEQQSNAEAINTTMINLSDQTNQNSATAEEMASSAVQLAEQAEQLKNLIEEINI